MARRSDPRSPAPGTGIRPRPHLGPAPDTSAPEDPRADGPRSDPILRAAARWGAQGWPAGPHFVAGLSILRVEELIRQSNDVALRPHHLTHSRHEALALLYFSRGGALPLGKLSQRLMIHPTSVTSTIDTLERLHLVERVAHPTDRRATLASITAAGRAALEGTCQAIAEARSGLAALTDDAATTIATTLTPVRAAAGDLGPESSVA